MIKVAIIEDNNTLRRSLLSLVNQTEEMQCVASLENLLNVVSELRKRSPDIVLMDIGLPNISGIEGVRTVKENFEKIQVLMFTVFEDDEKIFEAIKAGASGYLLKKSSPEEIIEAIRSLYLWRCTNECQYCTKSNRIVSTYIPIIPRKIISLLPGKVKFYIH